MSNFMMNKNMETANFASIEFHPYGAYSMYGWNAVEVCRRFLQAAATLSEEEYLGFEIAADKAGAPAGSVFSSEGTEVSIADYEWIFESNAAVTPKQPVETEDYFLKERQVYMLACKKATKETEAAEENKDSDSSYEYSDNMAGFVNLLNMMRSTGDVFLRMLLRGDGDGGVKDAFVLISLPSCITLRMKAVLSGAFPFVLIKKADSAEGDFRVQGIPADYMVKGMIGLQNALMQYKSEEEAEREFDGFLYEEECVEDEEISSEADSKKPAVSELTPEEVSNMSIADLELSVRAYNCLKRAGVETVGQLCAMSDEELAKVRNLGKRSLEEIKEKIGLLPAFEKQTALTAVNYQAMLDELIGLKAVKEQVKKITAYVKMKQDMEASGRAGAPVVLNMEFTGNPGTAKTTVARILAGIFHEIGLLSTAEIVEVGRADLIAKYAGHTADKVRNVFREARGKLLFIDEAYSLLEQWKGAYGDEAIGTIVQEMENHRDETIVVFAGYPKEMDAFFSRNPGLRSRVPFRIAFPDYSAQEMGQIAELEAGKRGFSIDEQAKGRVVELCRAAKAAVNAGNGRFCRNLVENAILGYAARVYGEEEGEVNSDYVLTASDFSDVVLTEKKKAAGPIGFRAA